MACYQVECPSYYSLLYRPLPRTDSSSPANRRNIYCKPQTPLRNSSESFALVYLAIPWAGVLIHLASRRRYVVLESCALDAPLGCLPDLVLLRATLPYKEWQRSRVRGAWTALHLTKGSATNSGSASIISS